MKATIVRPDGSRIEVDGSPEEISKLAESLWPPPPATIAPFAPPFVPYTPVVPPVPQTGPWGDVKFALPAVANGASARP